jgi:hypothetical protein
VGALALLVVVIAVALGAALSDAAPRSGVGAATCAQRSGGSWPDAFSNPDNLVVGPMTFVALNRNAPTLTDDAVRRFGGVKSPALVRHGHTVVVKIGRPARSLARLDYEHTQDRFDFDALPYAVRFRSCARRRAGDRRATFWSGFFILKQARACVPIALKVDRRPAVHRTLAFGNAVCQ